jgi:hypothetical protein
MVNIYLTKVTRKGTFSACPASITVGGQIQEVLREFLGQCQLDGPYESETELRATYKGVGANTPYVGIYVIEKDVSYTNTRLSRAGGDHVYDGAWKEIEIR